MLEIMWFSRGGEYNSFKEYQFLFYKGQVNLSFSRENTQCSFSELKLQELKLNHHK